MSKVRYTVVIEWDPEEQLYIANIPALSVGSYGETKEETIAKMKEAAEVTIEGLKATGQPVPVVEEDVVGFVELAV